MFDQSNEIQEIMSRSYEMPFDLDEADLEQGEAVPFPIWTHELELQDLVLDVDEEIPSYLSETDIVLPSLDLPQVPSQVPSTVVPNAPQGQGQ